MTKPLSVTIFIGAPGTRGTGLLERLTNDCGGLRVAAITPWKASKRAAARTGLTLLPTTQRLKRLGQGCSCCTVRWDVLTKVRRLAEEGRADHVVIQVPPQSDLESLAKTFTVPDDTGAVLEDVAQIQQVVTMVDGPSFLDTLRSDAAATLMERVGTAHTVWVDAATTLDADVETSVVRAIEAMNPDATLLRGDGGPIPISILTGAVRSGDSGEQSGYDVEQAMAADSEQSDFVIQSG